MSRETVIRCDMCWKVMRLVPGEGATVQVLVARHAKDEYGVTAFTHYGETIDMDLCQECLDRATTLEMNFGLVAPTFGEEPRWRE